MKYTLLFFIILFSSCSETIHYSGNPVFRGWYADPEGVILNKEYWIFPTYSAPYKEQLFLDAFSSKDLVKWKKHERIIDTSVIKWAWQEVWLGKPLIDKFHNGAQPIDQFAFRDTDGQYYLIYGGWRHCNIAKLNDGFTGIEPEADGAIFREITPEGYVEGPFMFIRNGKYYFMWPEGGWTGPDYSVAYAIADNPFGPFKRVGKILQQDRAIATGAGHHSVIYITETDKYYIVYHRRPLDETDRNAREVCIDMMEFDDNGFIKPVTITKTGVNKFRL